MTKHGWYQFSIWSAYVRYSLFSEEHWFSSPSLLTYPSCLESLKPVSPSLLWGPAAVSFFYWEKILSLLAVISVHLPEIRKKKKGCSFTDRSSVTTSPALGGGWGSSTPSEQHDQILLMGNSRLCVLKPTSTLKSCCMCSWSVIYIFLITRFIWNKMLWSHLMLRSQKLGNKAHEFSASLRAQGGHNTVHAR